MALIGSAIANDGVLMKPYLLEEVRSARGATVKTFDTEEYGSLMTADEAATLTEYMKGRGGERNRKQTERPGL